MKYTSAYVKKLEKKLKASEATIFKQKNTASLLKQSEKRYRTLHDQSPIAKEMYDSKGKLLLVNHSCLKLFGVKKSDHILGFSLFTDPNISSAHKKEFLSGKTISYEAAFDFEKVKKLKLYPTTKSGIIWLSVTIAPLKTKAGKVFNYLVQIQDITEHKKAEEALRESEENLKQILNAIDAIVFVKSPDAKLMWGNKKLLNYYGMTEEQLRGIVDAPFVAPDITKKYIRDDLHVATTGKTLDIPEEVITRHDGEIRYFHTVKVPIFDSNKKVVKIVGISSDLTNIKLAEKEKEKIQAQLFHQEKLASVGTLAAGVAHEINNPLTIIKGFTDILKKKLSQNIITQNEFDILDKQEKAAERIANIVAGLRNFTRADTDSLEIIDLNKVIQETLDLIQIMFIKENITIEATLDCTDPKIKANIGKLQQVLINMLTNAKDAILEIHKHGIIKITTANIKKTIVISISDDGAGVDEKLKDKIFDTFYTTKPPGKGTGLGLSISHSIITSFGGAISVESKKNIGTTFTITLPKD